ncbi:uncharacterized protein LOC134178483 [Corticium candelabrum]|uniref:uncharacterized protein LOC134178483 n=1 Tax=Corticium candelabrum TaxID=121492 RepID=UPI002E2706D9|nr:uncharacterized protein LOC134178483 [Corticium candelabrum]
MAWTEQETLLLIDLWGEESVQVQIEGCARNKEVYAKLAARMQEEGYNRSGTQCREKIKKLKTDYRKVKDNNNESGRARRSSRIFEAMDAILGHKPATCPPIVLESTNNPAHTDVTAVDSDASGSQGIELDDYDDESCVGELALSNCSSTGTTSRSTPTSSVCPSSPVANTPTAAKQKRNGTKRAREGQGKTRDRMKDMMQTIMAGMKEIREADSVLLIDLEEKRLKLEDARLREEREYAERKRREGRQYEERRRREEREFQLQMMQMMVGFGNQPSGQFTQHSGQFTQPWGFSNLLEDSGPYRPSQQE